MDVTVAICTWNRAELLDCTLASLSEMEVPRRVRLRVIVADNNSTDDTARVVERHSQQLPLERLFVETQGKSHALNAVIERLQGDLVLWTDDDVLLDRRWLTAYVEAAEQHPEVGFFGGKIAPYFLGGEPEWLRPSWEYLAGQYAERDFGNEPFAFDAERLPFGANWAVRVALQKRYLYKAELGRRGHLMLSGEETDVMQRLLADGHRGRWTPGCAVEHLITPERVDVDAIRRGFFGYILSTAEPASSRTRRALCGAWHALQASYADLVGSYFAAWQWHRLWMRYTMFASCSWGHVEMQWRDFSELWKPRRLRELLSKKHQSRYAKSLAPQIAALYERRRARYVPVVASDETPALQRRAA